MINAPSFFDFDFDAGGLGVIVDFSTGRVTHRWLDIDIFNSIEAVKSLM